MQKQMWKVVSDVPLSSPDYNQVSVVYQTPFHFWANLASWWHVLHCHPQTLYVTNFSEPDLTKWLDMVNSDTTGIYQNGARLRAEQRRHFWVWGCLVLLGVLFLWWKGIAESCLVLIFCFVIGLKLREIARKTKGARCD